MLDGRILITGGSGFLGRAILRRAKRDGWDARFTIFSRDEMKQWELKRRYPDAVCVLGDVAGDRQVLAATMAGHDMVIHAAAVKFIPEAEHNVFEAVKVNVEGSRNVAIAAIDAGVPLVVGISTDKAAAPSNLYGATKMIMERIFAEANRFGTTRFVTARYGNVVGSTGSVIPVFFQQLADFGELRVTDARMSRFWLGADEAIDLICWAANDAAELPGHTFISACPAMAITALGRAVHALWQRPPTQEAPHIVFTGLRPGEKIAEALFSAQEASRVQVVSGLPLILKRLNGTGFLMAPATTSHPPVFPMMEAYESSKPNRWLGIEEMMDLIEDAKEI